MAIKGLGGLGCVLSLSGCGSIHYLIQAGIGQMGLLNHSRPISEVIKDERTSPRIKSLLGDIGSIKKFGELNGLKPTSNYTKYVQLDRKAAVWVVSGCEPLRFQAKEWHFPLVGSFPYLGWFDHADATRYAEELKKEGWDVDLRGASAYSTLGWFQDPVLSTMISDGDEALGDLVNVVIHESVHATLYINGQSYFNESLANFIADYLTPRYLEAKHGLDSKVRLAYLDQEKRSQELQKKLHEVYGQLEALYHSKKSDLEKSKDKEEIFKSLKLNMQSKRDLNNATIIQFKTYHTGAQVFQQLLDRCEGQVTRLISLLNRLKPEDFSRSQQDDLHPVLDVLTQSGSY